MVRLLPWLLFVTVLAACSVGVDDGPIAAGDGPQITVEPPPEPDWRREVEGVTVAGAGTPADREELALLGAGLGELPAELIEQAGLETIYRVRDGEITVEEQTLAFSRGPDIFLIDRTFASEPTAFDMATLLAHELAHVMQFNRLTQEDADAVAGVVNADPIAGSEFVRDFAESAGWRDRSSKPGDPVWLLADASGTTPYGTTAPDEDMAESIALILTGRADHVSRDRLEWLEDLLGLDGPRFTAGKPFIPVGAERIDPTQPLYDVDAVAVRTAQNADPITFALPSDAAAGETLAGQIEAALLQRGLGGGLSREQDRRIERYTGRFLRGDGVGFWVELWDFRNAPGFVDPPQTPVLTYVMLW
jgi:hypothetical protein